MTVNSVIVSGGSQEDMTHYPCTIFNIYLNLAHIKDIASPAQFYASDA